MSSDKFLRSVVWVQRIDDNNNVLLHFKYKFSCKYVQAGHFFQVKETPTYAPFYIPEDDPMNGRSYMEFSTDLSAVTIKDGASIGSKSLGSWKAGLSNPLQLSDPDNMSDYSAQLVYRVVTVEVGFINLL